ncbi:MAG TPA: HAMP domain-containing histidine kinase [Epsilonproteobacteria bacterium]|nr:HAMP domain-containing histidine kinase [Campylobacterota bacterium]HHD79751.1 HAMP domain-containing histidine kinase [Campylobacterota bacterium]
MIYRRPHFREYVMARLVTMAIALFLVFAGLFLFYISDDQVAYTAMGILGLGFIAFIYAINRGAKRMQDELNIINKYLKNLDNIETINHKAHFFTQEFEEINQNLMKVLKKSKKREDIKQRYNAKLKLKNRQRADMLSAIAHEFRNPIASIMGYSQTLQDDPEIPSELREKFLSKIYNNGNKIEALLARLIMWNKFESQETRLHKTSFDMLVLLKDVKVALEEKYVDRSIQIYAESYMVQADRTLMDVVLKNLIENALKYSKEDVIVRIENGLVSVEDKGVGISEKDLDKVTKKFYRSGTHTWDNSMGLGLSIVKTILNLHQSKLEISSTKEEGSTFSFMI